MLRVLLDLLSVQLNYLEIDDDLAGLCPNFTFL